MKDKTREIATDRENFAMKRVGCEKGRERFCGFLFEDWESRVLCSDQSHWNAMCLPAQSLALGGAEEEAGLGTRGAGGLGSKGDEASGRREGARGQEAAL